MNFGQTRCGATAGAGLPAAIDRRHAPAIHPKQRHAEPGVRSRSAGSADSCCGPNGTVGRPSNGSSGWQCGFDGGARGAAGTYARLLAQMSRVRDVRHRVKLDRKQRTAELLANLADSVRGHVGIQLRTRRNGCTETCNSRVKRGARERLRRVGSAARQA